MKILTPYYTLGNTGTSGRVIWSRFGRWYSIITSLPGAVHAAPLNPYRLNFGGWTVGIFGVNVWFSLRRKQA